MLTKNQITELRKQIVLNSLFLKDYTNSFNIDSQKVCDFFNSVLDYYKEYEIENITNDMIYDYYISFEDDPLKADVKIYAKVLNCEDNFYYLETLKEDIKETQSENIFICYDEKNGINNDLINDLIEHIYYFSDWALSGYYKNNLAALIIDYIKPYKKISLKSALKIVKAIKEETNKDDFILTCLNAIYNKRYEKTGFHGYCQGDYAKVFYAIDEIDNYYLKYAEAVIMGTGCEVMIHDEIEDPSNADEISGYCDYFIGYKLKEEIADRIGCNIDDIILYEIDNIQVIHKVIYKLAK